VHEIWEQASFFFVAPTAYDEGTVKKFWHPETPAIMDEVRSLLQSVQPFVASSIEPAIKGYINEKGHGMGKVMNAIRLSLVGESKGPGVADICELLGQDETAKRIENAIATLA
nr:glutamate--tRNA ligase [Tenuifilaceae bacterium]